MFVKKEYMYAMLWVQGSLIYLQYIQAWLYDSFLYTVKYVGSKGAMF